MDAILMETFETTGNYLRVLPEDMTAHGDFVQTNFIVEFKDKHFLAEYNVRNGLEPHLKHILGPRDFIIPFVTNTELDKCLIIEGM